MKLPLTIALTIAFLNGWAQTDSDSLKVAAPDSLASLALPDSLWWAVQDSTVGMITPPQELYITTYSSLEPIGIYMYIPACKDLENRKGMLYYFIDGVAIPFCGQCVETNDGKGITVLYSKEVYTLPEIIKSDNTVKAAHKYKDGVRQGNSEYFDKNGKLVTNDQ